MLLEDNARRRQPHPSNVDDLGWPAGPIRAMTWAREHPEPSNEKAGVRHGNLAFASCRTKCRIDQLIDASETEDVMRTRWLHEPKGYPTLPL